MMTKKNKANSKVEVVETSGVGIDWFATEVPMFLDTPGIFFVEAKKRVRTANRNLKTLSDLIKEHQLRVISAPTRTDIEHPDDPWIDIIHGVSQFETLFAKTVRDFAIAEILLVAAAESYINAIAEHVLSRADATMFDKLSPIGKWLFLPQIMKLKWRPETSKGHLQEFSSVVSRRNRFIHPKQVSVKGATEAHDFIRQLHIDAKLASRGVNAVGGLMQEISRSWRGSTGPNWLKDTLASNRPPCFTLGGPDMAFRLGRGRRKSTKSDSA